MAKYIHNISEENKTYQGREVEAGSFFLIEPSWEPSYMSDSQLIADLSNGIVKMSANGSTSVSGNGSAHVDFLKGIDLSPRDSDGAPLQRTKITTTGWAYQLHSIEAETSKLDSVVSKKADNTDWGYVTIKHYKLVEGVETLMESPTQEELDSDCIKTVLDWEPTHDYEIIGGFFRQLVVPTQDIRLWVIGVPDVPAIAGGSKCFASSINLRYAGLEEGLKVDGRAPKYLTYNATYHTNKLQLILRHPAGFKHKFSFIFEIFKA